jgi:AraC-like DNA-binding protein
MAKIASSEEKQVTLIAKSAGMPHGRYINRCWNMLMSLFNDVTNAGQWIQCAEGQQRLAPAAVDRFLIQPDNLALLRIQLGEKSQVLGPGHYLHLAQGESLQFFCSQPLMLFAVALENTRQVDIVTICADPILTHACDIFSLQQRCEAGQDAQVAWEALVLTRARKLAQSEPVKVSKQQISSNADAAKVAQLNQFIDAKLAHPLCVEDMASHLLMGKMTFLRWAKASLHCTPCQYLIQRRLQRAKQLLTSTELALVDIALQTGFASQSHFNNTFKLVSAMTPRAYRMQLGEALAA